MNFEALSDSNLVEFLKTASGSSFEEGFRELVRRYKNPIITFLYRYTSDLKTSEDLAQECFLRIFKKLQDYNSTAKFSTWIYTIACNLAKDEFKRRRRHPAAPLDWKSSGHDDTTRTIPALADGQDDEPVAHAERSELGQKVQEVLRSLGDEDREVLILREIQGLKYEEIAQILELPMGTVKSRIARARQAFKDASKRLGLSIDVR